MRLEAVGILLSPPDDAWKLVGEPYHLSDWWPGYRGIEPDRRGLVEGARWTVSRGPTGAGTSNLLRRPAGEGIVVIKRVPAGSALAWHDVDLEVDCTVTLEPAAERRTRVQVAIEGSWMRITAEGLRSVPKQAIRRLHDLCQTSWPYGQEG
jgi:hypothetical protein